MPECQNCGAFVTEQYQRVFTPDDEDAPRVCPNCDDMIRDGAEVRPARSHRGGDHSKPVSYDSAKAGGD